MISPDDQATPPPDGHAPFLARFPGPLYKVLRKHCFVEREPTISINAFIVLAVKNQLVEEGVSLT
jgi:hypothetical protein